MNNLFGNLVETLPLLLDLIHSKKITTDEEFNRRIQFSSNLVSAYLYDEIDGDEDVIEISVNGESSVYIGDGIIYVADSESGVSRTFTCYKFDDLCDSEKLFILTIECNSVFPAKYELNEFINIRDLYYEIVPLWKKIIEEGNCI